MSNLMTPEIARTIPALYSQSDSGLEQKAVVKFFSPVGNWSWYATEFDGEDVFFGLVDGFEKELGNFSLTELESIEFPDGKKIERDPNFQPTALVDLLK